MHINQEHSRYELHRVWVVEATLKDGKRQFMPSAAFTWTRTVGVYWSSISTTTGVAFGVCLRARINYYDILSFWTTLKCIWIFCLDAILLTAWTMKTTCTTSRTSPSR
ncbi:MAG: hypothetical protein CM1200mP29_04190 [Verrucomicrobiota bacterium]|nr:MAG: hypothetical protein CM1200mP29_04190 [Verrucomicrobiota bacterium]